MPTEILRPVDWYAVDTWPTGFVSNIDEPIETPDGNVIRTTNINDQCSFTLTDPTQIRQGIDTVTAVRIKVRAASLYDPISSPYTPVLKVAMRIGGSSQGIIQKNITNVTAFVNYEYTYSGWNANWSVAELEGMTVALQSAYADDPLYFDFIEVDVVEVHVDYSLPPPIVESPGVGPLLLSEQSPVAKHDKYARPTPEELVLAAEAGTLFRQDYERPNPDQLVFTFPAPKRIVNHVGQPAAKEALLTGKIPQPGAGLSPAADTLDLAGQAPTVLIQTNIWVTAGGGRLWLAGTRPGIGGEDALPQRVRLFLASDAPDLQETHKSSPPAVELTLTGDAPTLSGDIEVPEGALVLQGVAPNQAVPIESLDLAGSAPELTYSRLIPGGALTLTGLAPLPGPQITTPAGSLVLSGQVPLSEYQTVTVPEGAMTLTGRAGPGLEFASVLIAGDPGIISVTSNYGIEHIATPTEEV